MTSVVMTGLLIKNLGNIHRSASSIAACADRRIGPVGLPEHAHGISARSIRPESGWRGRAQWPDRSAIRSNGSVWSGGSLGSLQDRLLAQIQAGDAVGFTAPGDVLGGQVPATAGGRPPASKRFPSARRRSSRARSGGPCTTANERRYP